jgi:hypothetical protein
MAWIWFKGKKRKVLSFLNNPASPKGIRNFVLTVEGDHPGMGYDVPFLRVNGFKECPSTKKYNDNVLKAARAYFKEGGR